MAGILGIGADEPVMSSSSRRSWISASFRDPSDVFRRSTAAEDDEGNLRWAAIERLPTYDRMRKGILRELGDNGIVTSNEVDLQKLGMQERKILVDRIMKIVEEDNERFLKRLRDRYNQFSFRTPLFLPF